MIHKTVSVAALTINHIFAIFRPVSILIITQTQANIRTVAAQMDSNLNGVNPYALIYIAIFKKAINAKNILSTFNIRLAIFIGLSKVCEVLVESQNKMKLITITPHMSPKPFLAYCEYVNS